jgi:LysR family glycine cleavage system transcriptional activator
MAGQPKKKSLPPLRALRAFEAAARLQSFTRAAEELGVTQAAVSQQIRLLERHLATPLFRRRGRRLELTEAAQVYLPVVTAAFERLARGTDEVFGAGPPLRVQVGTSFALGWLAPRLPRFRARHPRIRLTLLARTWPFEGESEVDLEIVNGRPARAGAEVERLTREHFRVAASPAWLKRRPYPADARGWTRTPVIVMRGYGEGWADWLRRHGPAEATPPVALETDSTAVAIEAAAEGVGLLLARSLLLDAAFASKRLVAAHPGTLASGDGHWLVRRPGSAPGPSAQAFVRWLREELGDAAALAER